MHHSKSKQIDLVVLSFAIIINQDERFLFSQSVLLMFLVDNDNDNEAQ